MTSTWRGVKLTLCAIANLLTPIMLGYWLGTKDLVLSLHFGFIFVLIGCWFCTLMLIGGEMYLEGKED